MIYTRPSSSIQLFFADRFMRSRRIPYIMVMNGVGTTLGPQLMAEIGDVTRFVKRGSLTAFAGVDPGKNESGKYSQKSVPTSKKGSPHMRKTLFQIMDGLIQRSPTDAIGIPRGRLQSMHQNHGTAVSRKGSGQVPQYARL